jgi:hypothetical protein
MHCTAFTSFPKPLALIVACDTAIFRPRITGNDATTVVLCGVSKIRLDHVMKKTTTLSCHFTLKEAEGNILLKRIMISSINEIVSTDERPVNMNMLEKIQFQLEHLSKSERKVAEVILASPLRRFIQASPLWHRKRASANRRSTASAAAWKRAAFLILNCIWHKVWQTAPLC